VVWSITRSRGAICILTLAALLFITTAKWSSAWMDGVGRESDTSGTTPPRLLPIEVSQPPKAVIRVDGKPAPGLQLTLHAEGSTENNVRFRWVQTRGPAVQLIDPSAKTARFTVPEGTGPMGFMLVASNAQGVDVASVSIPLEGLSRSAESANAPLRADPGDDQLGLVGRQVTLNGVRSEPKGNIGYRWVQVGGPPVRLKIEDGYIYSYVPTAPGVYRFALVVGSGSQLSEPSVVTVTVGSGTPRPAADQVSASASVPAAPVAIPTQEVARTGLASVGGMTQLGEDLARIFEDVSDKMDLYETYTDAFSELSRRLEDVFSRDPARRNLLVERVFTPLTTRIIEVLQAEGLDLRSPQGQAAALASNQKTALAEQFRLMADGFRKDPKTP
jgi:hypothetical protein